MSGTFQAIVHRVFTCAMVSSEYYENIAQDFFLYNDVWDLSDNIVHGFYQCNVISQVLGQH